MSPSEHNATVTVRRKAAGVLRSVGPALVVAAVVLGPGSILTASRAGCAFGYDVLWVVFAAAAVMAAMTAVAAHVGCRLSGSPCDELAVRLGRPVAVVVGATLFLVVAGFQASNNLAVLAGLEAMWPSGGGGWARGGVVLLNAGVLVVLWRGRDLYRPIETLMKLLVAVMVAAFAVNLAFARPSPVGMLSGLLPRWPRGGSLLPLAGLVATTFSIAAAFYQAYLVREKGWSAADTRRGLVDSLVGVAALAVGTAMVLATSAAVLHGRVEPSQLTSVGDVAGQLRPTFGAAATGLFSAGILAGAVSSFLGNAVIGGTLLADGLGRPSGLNDRPQKWATTAALLIGATLGLLIAGGSVDRVQVIVLAQAATVLGGPVLAGGLLYLAWQCRPRPSWWALGPAFVGAAVVAGLTARTLAGLLD